MRRGRAGPAAVAEGGGPMTHPPEDQLARLLADEVAPEGRGALEAHVNGCDKCLARLEAIRRARPADVRLLVELLVRPPAGAGETDHQPPSYDPCANGQARRGGEPLPSFAGYE